MPCEKLGKAKWNKSVPFQEEVPFPEVDCKNIVPWSKERGRLKLIASLKRYDNFQGFIASSQNKGALDLWLLDTCSS